MKKAVLVCMFALGFAVNAQAKVLKAVTCEGATLSMKLAVTTEEGEATIVAWNIEDSETGAGSQFMGYLFSQNGLKEFSSTDLGSDVELAGSVALVTFGEKEETLLCK